MKKMLMGLIILSISIGFISAESLDLTTPDGGESWEKGSSKTIRWTGSDIPGTLRILLLRDNTRIGVIARGLPASTRSHPWTVGNHDAGNVGPGTNYKIRIKVEGHNLSDTSNGPFEIKTERPSIRVTLPHSGSVWDKGEPQEVRWKPSGNMQNCVKIKLFSKNGILVSPLLNDSSTPNDGTCGNIKIPKTVPPGKYRIQVETCNRQVFNRSPVFVVKNPAGSSGQSENPDLVITDLYKDGNLIMAKVKNRGSTSIPAVTPILFQVNGLGRSFSIGGGVYSINESPRISSLGSIGTNEVRLFPVYTIPSDHIYNNYCSIEFTVVVNSDHGVTESNYSNNTKVKTICKTVAASVSFTHTIFCGPTSYFTVNPNQTVTIEPCNVRGWRDGYAFMSIRVDAVNTGFEPVDVIVSMIQKNNSGSVIYSGIVNRGELASCQRRAFSGNTAGMPLQEGTITLEIRNSAGNALLGSMTYNIRWHGTILLLPRGGIYE